MTGGRVDTPSSGGFCSRAITSDIAKGVVQTLYTVSLLILHGTCALQLRTSTSTRGAAMPERPRVTAVSMRTLAIISSMQMRLLSNRRAYGSLALFYNNVSIYVPFRILDPSSVPFRSAPFREIVPAHLFCLRHSMATGNLLTCSHVRSYGSCVSCAVALALVSIAVLFCSPAALLGGDGRSEGLKAKTCAQWLGQIAKVSKCVSV